MAHVRRRFVVENTWKCDSCGHENRGRDLVCASCGSPKEKHERYDTSGNATAPEVTDQALVAAARAGKNWHCEFCGCDARAPHGGCANCGAGKPIDPVADRPAERQPRPSFDLPPPCSSGGAAVKALVALASVLALGGLVWLVVWLMAPREVTAKVTAVSWSCRADLYRRELKQGVGWRSSAPVAAFDMSCEKKQDGTEDCNPHDCNPHTETYDCRPHDCNCRRGNCVDQGNGFSECEEVCDTCYDECSKTVYDTCHDQCPVYREWCSYSYHEEHRQDTRRLTGTDHAVVCPTLTARGSDERVSVSEDYAVQFVGNDGGWAFSPASRADFAKYRPGDAWLISVTRLGKVTPLHPANATKKE